MDPIAPELPMTQEPTPAPEPPPPTSHRPARLVVLAAAVLGIGALVLLMREGATPPRPATGFTVEGNAVEMSPSAPQWRYIELATATAGAPLPGVPAPARITVDEGRSAPIFAPLPGRVERVSVQLGQEVKPGDRLLALRSSALPELGREEQSARAALAVKTALSERVRDLVQLRAVPEKDLILAEQEKHEAELSLKAAQGKRRSLRIDARDDESGLYWLTATKRGTVVERKALVGMEVGPDRTDPLLSVADLAEVIVVADLLERDAGGIRPGQRAEVTDVALGGKPAEGTVEYVAQLVDPVRRTVAVRVRVPNPEHRLRPNAFAQVTFPADAVTASQHLVVVPSEAVVTDDQKSVVFVRKAAAGGKTRLERREVQPGRMREGRTEIVSGLGVGESYVARGALLLLNALDLAS
jgi:cobalt-zinc-cadmium efflux system membrane fusion protein